MSVQFLRQVERDFLSRKTTGNTAQTPLGQLQRKYWISLIGATASGEGLGTLEIAGLKKAISNAGGTPTATDSRADLWKQLVAAIGKAPSKFVNDNKIIYYTNAS